MASNFRCCEMWSFFFYSNPTVAGNSPKLTKAVARILGTPQGKRQTHSATNFKASTASSSQSPLRCLLSSRSSTLATSKGTLCARYSDGLGCAGMRSLRKANAGALVTFYAKKCLIQRRTLFSTRMPMQLGSFLAANYRFLFISVNFFILI